jgi:type IV pilus assembly protein PilY1
MRNAIAADLSLIDMDSDGATDRLYAADTGGRIIRVDFNQSSMSGDVIADINAGSVSGNRQFFNRPVIAYMGSYLAITIGSGRRPFIFDDTVTDRFYMIKDSAVWGPPEDGNYTRVTESNLTDHTTGFDPSMTSGWYFDLKHIGTDASGNPVSINEKSVTRTVVYDGIVYFNTIAGSKEIKDVSCTPSTTSTSAYFYAVKINTGDAAIAHFDGNSELDEVDDRSRKLKTPTIPEAPFVYVGSKQVTGDDGQDILVPLREVPVSPGVGEQSEAQPNRYRAIYWESSLGD